MGILARYRLSPSWTGVLLALALPVLAAPPPARAECGDYVRFGQAARDPAGAAPAWPVQMPEGRHSHPVLPFGHHGSCTGPMCSDGPALPAEAPAPVSPDRAEQWAATSPPASPAGPEKHAQPSDDPAGRPVRQSTDVFRPPR
jgi:hypothetical protein